jgi:uncharacterized RDD family membrane protein YckC
MKCPKCSYLSFEAGERCRNCGYDFSMSSPAVDDPAGDLPLFDDAPLVSVPASPRPPLSVRRTTQDPARLRSRHAPPVPPQPPRSAELDLQFESEPAEPAIEATQVAAAEPRATGAPLAATGVRRMGAAIIDLTLMLLIDLAVIHFTLRLAGLDWSGFFTLPLAPLLAFFALLNGGYFVMFTAATGQTIGKMAAGIRVVGNTDGADDRVTFGRAVLRTAGYLASLLPAGLGFIPAFVGPRDHRALHDRLAATRVVRA